MKRDSGRTFMGSLRPLRTVDLCHRLPVVNFLKISRPVGFFWPERSEIGARTTITIEADDT